MRNGSRSDRLPQMQDEELPRRVDKPWGHELWFAQTDRYAGKRLHVRAGQCLSVQYHEKKDETSYLLSGRLRLSQGSSADSLVTTELVAGAVWRSELGLDWLTQLLQLDDTLLTLAADPDTIRDAIKAVGEDTQVTGERQQTMKKATTTMKTRKSGSKEGKGGDSPSQLIDARIKELSDWRGETLARVRILIKQADPEVVEEWKWRGVPVWSHAGMICTGETYKNVVKMTFAKGASLEDPSGLFNSSLEGNTRRAIDFHEGDKIDEKALKALIRAAVALNTSSAA
jgi:hypothetical protein